MASKKSKVLAIAFCAAVMAGIHVNPVLAYNPGKFDTDTHVEAGPAYVDQETGKVTMNLVNKVNTKVGEVTIDGLASDSELKKETQKRTESDTKLQKQINNNATAIGNEADAREKADADLQDQIDGHTNQIDSMGDQLDDLKAKDEKQDATLEGHTNQIDSMGDQLDDLKAKDEKQDATLEGHTNQIDSMGDQLDDLKANDEKQDATLEGHTNQIDSMGDQLDDLKANDEKQDATLEGHTNQINSMGTQLDDLKANDELQDATLDGHTNQISSIGKELNDLKANDEAQDADIDKLQENDAVQDGILDAHGQQIGDNTAAIKNHTSVIGVEDNSQLKNEYADTNYISGANDMVEADVILDREISDVNSRVDRLDDRIDKVGAMAAAIANLHTMGYDPAAPTEVAVGVGQYRDETGMALGLFHYPNRDFMLSLSVSTSGDEYMGGIGATWKFGRKSPEKVAEIKKAQAEADARRAEEQKLAKAEEMKKAAKEAKVQAQMERHAKLAAERAALEEA